MRHRGISSIICLLVAGLFVLGSPMAFAQEKMPWDGIVELSTTSVAAGVGLSWGSGVLTYQGKKIPFKVDGLTVGKVGISGAQATGIVYNLKNPGDLAGNYAAVTAGAAVGGGAAGLTMKNQKGVIIDLTATTQGVDFTFATSGVKIEMR